MIRLGRATGFAVAALSAAAGLAFAGPSQAGESDAPADTAHYSGHAAAAPVATVLAVNSLTASPVLSDEDASVASPIAEHALASVEQVVSELEDTGQTASAKSLSELVNDYASSEVPDAELECLATAVYFEAKSEPLAGQLTVAEVLINRTQSGRFPSSLCGVVKQRGQFSFVHGGQLPVISRASPQWRRAVAIATIARQDLADGSAPRALFFHARRVSPGWKLTRVAAVGNHVFYR
ncbi:MAG: cell wall hydrolase [Alphaproteobacteria bacterium]|nr:cell wall hydrolase [Alphaproteobacteria bacterium]